jgi:phosphatidate cytidylyltransferase
MAKPISSELVLRINSALVLVALTLALTYAGTQTFAALILFAATLMSWEWGRVVRGTGIDGIFAIQSAAIIGAGYFTLKHHSAAAVAIIFVATWLAFRLHQRMDYRSDPWWSAAGVY